LNESKLSGLVSAAQGSVAEVEEAKIRRAVVAAQRDRSKFGPGVFFNLVNSRMES
jgi:hypothetical protein